MADKGSIANPDQMKYKRIDEDRIEHSTYRRKADDTELQVISRITKLLPEPDKKLYKLVYKDEKTNTQISKSLKIKADVVIHRIHRLNGRINILSKIPLSKMSLVLTVLNPLLTPQARVVWKEWLGVYSFTEVGNRLSTDPRTISRLVKSVRDAADACGHPEVRKIVTSLYNNRDHLVCKRES